jgi:hypothetical protein
VGWSWKLAQEVGAYQERSPLGVLRSAPHEYYSESLVMAYGFGQ